MLTLLHRRECCGVIPPQLLYKTYKDRTGRHCCFVVKPAVEVETKAETTSV